MIGRFVTVSLLTVVACTVASESATAGAKSGSFIRTLADGSSVIPRKTSDQSVYWTLFAGAQYPQVQIANVPLRKRSKATTIRATSNNNLLETSGVAFDAAGRFWILSYTNTNGDPTTALVFDLPITAQSAPLYTLVLSGTVNADALAFDPSGNLWVTSPGNQSVIEYTGPFTQSATLVPAKTVTAGIDTPFGVAVDQHANLYISNNHSTGTDSIAVVQPPYTGQPYFLNGLASPGGLAFDKAGNLYASTNQTPGAVVRYNSNHLKSGDGPSIVDPTGLDNTSYEASFAFAANGDLYAANCGGHDVVGIQVWRLSRKKFSAHLAPSVSYTNKKIQGIGCTWGVTIN